ERSALERYVVLEELLAAGAPVAAHWIADRQSGPLLLRYGSEAQRERFLPAIARGEMYFCIGLSEPGSGSDLAAVRTRVTKTVDGGVVARAQRTRALPDLVSIVRGASGRGRPRSRRAGAKPARNAERGALDDTPDVALGGRATRARRASDGGGGDREGPGRSL